MEFEEIFKKTKKYLSIIGFSFELEKKESPRNLRDKVRQITKKYYAAFALCNVMLIGVFSAAFLYQNAENLSVASHNIVMMSFAFLFGLKGFIILWKKQEIGSIMRTLKEMYSTNDGADQDGRFFLKMQSFVLKLYAATVVGNILRAFMVDLRNDFETKTLLYKLTVPFDYDPLGVFLALHIWCVYVTISGLLCQVAIDGSFFGLIIILAGEINEIGNNLENFDCTSDYDGLKKIIERYRKLLDISNSIESCFTLSNFLTVFNGAIVSCFIVFQLMMDENPHLKFISPMIKLTIWMSQVFFCFYYCQKLQTVNKSISEKIMRSNWYEAKDKRVAVALQFTMMKAQQPIKMTAMKFTIITMEGFKSVLVAGYSYFSFMTHFVEQ